MKRKAIILLLLLSLLALALPATTLAGPHCAQWHTVQRGENLYRIALRYGTSVSYLSQLNGISDPSRIYAGQALCIVPPGSSGTAYVVQRGDTLVKIARRYGVNMYVLAQNNNIWNINRLYAGQTIYIPDFTIQY
jgi:LysM repeat protein